MSLSLHRIKRIEELANSIIDGTSTRKLFIDVKKIASALGVAVMSYDLGDDISGVLVLNDDQGTIAYNPRHSELRTRFTIAHELGHYILHKKNRNDIFVDRDFIVMYRRGNKSYTQEELIQEQEANAFAAALLMPQELIEKELEANNYYCELAEPELIVKLAKTFKVSIPAMTFRLSNLSILA